ncbi:hypothetical protein LCGC14_1016940 [marine sediment metagenome]|uniref:Uncharacterized protein n=1 Tax=marine sediment metagenome TaxID=412755 RepID=A0A0F9R4M5_9ZZZZ
MHVKMIAQPSTETEIYGLDYGQPFSFDGHTYIKSQFKCKDITQAKPRRHSFCTNLKTGGVRFLEHGTLVTTLRGEVNTWKIANGHG